MNKYFVLFRVPVASMDEWMRSSTAENRKNQSDVMMKEWKTWQREHADSIVDNGLPLGKTKTVTPESIKDSRNDLNYFMIIQANSHDEAAKLIVDNPHLKIPTSFIDVMEIPHMGM